MTSHTVHIFEAYEDFAFKGWRWQCDCGAHSSEPQSTNKAAARLARAHLSRKHTEKI